MGISTYITRMVKIDMTSKGTQLPQAADIVIAGGGLAGVLAAARLAAAHPTARIVLLEKDAVLGGRLRTTSKDSDRVFSYGLNAISEKLFDFWQQTLRQDIEMGDELVTTGVTSQSKVGILSGSKIADVDIDLWFSAKGARALGGYTAARQWEEVESIVHKPRAGAVVAHDDDGDEADAEGEEEETKLKPFGHYWSKPRKAPAAIVLEFFGGAFGIPDIWSAHPEAIAERAGFHAGKLRSGALANVLKQTIEQPSFQQAVTVVTSARIGDARYADNVWTVDAAGGSFTAPVLIVAQPPWQAIEWLPRSFWPTQLLQIANKTKPVSAVVLSERIIKGNPEMPDVVIIPAERVQVVRNDKDELAFQCTIDFELSLQAPAVLKAVRQLKRAKKKLMAMFPDLVLEGDHIMLQPVAWAQSPASADVRWLERLGRKTFNAEHLAFCGDAYGPSYDGDVNLVKSVVSALDSIKDAPSPP